MTIDYKSAGYTAFPFVAVNPLDSGETMEVLNEKVRPGHIIGHEGMTLRDYFAAAAMRGFNANPDEQFTRLNLTAIAQMAYSQADEMLKAREVKS